MIEFIDCQREQHSQAILDIFNEAIVNSTALYDYRPRPPESMAAWFATKQASAFPVVGAVDESGQLLGFASYGTFRAWPAYKYSVEHSVYIHKDHRGKGLGLQLMQALIERAKGQGKHIMVGGIDMTNTPSIALHERLGFKHSGTIEQAAFKFGRWLDLGFYQLILNTPAEPADG
ncbi:GNAT family N-acetyltransferase [Variovorax sp. PCZ-1]|uniref:GNAT family N-acetyltransferase n=1 Tax=Variovorax sp. PCZ-1 TaxID=2835533 RepID=UPI001BCBECA2|nr:GNAT family N-acetyltransferase [Variovorax sp. PCZ-1]MBS7806859.1 N-acetyltransferase [Variovorax sp. PCZ-1]